MTNSKRSIEITEDYTLFDRIEGNRLINKGQVKRLFSSFNRNPVLVDAVPIIVNDKYQIVDGQHRLEAIKLLKKPVPYIMVPDLTLEDVQILNSATKAWSPIDFAKSFAELGNQDYITYLNFREEYRITHEVLVTYLGQESYSAASFKAGKFKTGDLEKAHLLCRQLTDLKEFIRRGSEKKFAIGFKQIATHPDYDHARMIAKLRIKRNTIKDAVTQEDYMRQLERAYNYKVSEGERVKFF
jgi:hypothetical protein